MKRAQDRTSPRFELLGRWAQWWPPRPIRALAAALRDYFPWTPLGTLLSLGAIFGLRHFAYAELDVVWLVLGYAGLALLLLAPALVIPTALYLHFGQRQGRSSLSAELEGAGAGEDLAPQQLETGRWGETGFSLPTLALIPLIELRWQWRSPHAEEVRRTQRSGREWERVRLGDRGHYARVERGVAVGDVFGLCRIWLRYRADSPLQVLPALGRLPRLATLTAFAAGAELSHPQGLPEGDRLEISRYNPGDPARFIHWKLLARTRQLLVRRHETALSTAQRVAAFLVAGVEDDATAAVARAALDGGWFGADFLFGTAEQPAGVTSPAVAQRLVVRSSAYRERGAMDLPAFFAQADRGGPSAGLLFVPPVPGPWLDQVLPLCRARRLRAVIGVDELYDQFDPPLWRRLLWSSEAQQGHARGPLDKVVRALRTAGCDVVLIDRPNGRLLSDSHRLGRAGGQSKKRAGSGGRRAA